MKIKCRVLTFLLTIICCIVNAYGQKDSLFLKDKTVLLGEIKELKKGVLTYETSFSDSDFEIEWGEVSALSSNTPFLISLSSGERISAAFKRSEAPGVVYLVTESSKSEVNINNIVFFRAINESFLSRFDADISLGYNYTKSSNLSQFTVRSNAGYVGEKASIKGSYNTVMSSQDDVDPIRRTDAHIGGKFYLKNDWYAALNTDFLSNEEQLLKLRVATRGGIGKYFVHTNRLYFSSAVGVAWNNETYTNLDSDSNDSNNSMEAFLSLELDIFNIKDFSLYTELTAYPSITEKDRIRTDFKIDLKYDLPLNFFIKLGLTHNFDSKPVMDASRIDYVFQTTFGWEL